MVQRFTYVAVTPTGERHSGSVEAEDRASVVAELQRMGRLVVDVRVAAPEGLTGHVTANVTRALGSGRAGAVPSHSRAIGTREVTTFTRELSLLLTAGMSLPDALRSIGQDRSRSRIAALATDLRSGLTRGLSFEQALAERPAAFTPAYRSMVRLGETSGRLADVLSRVAASREKSDANRAQLVSALTYPALLILVAIAVIAVLLGYVVPQFKTMLASVGGEPPAQTAMLIAISDGLAAHGFPIAVAVCVVALALIWAARLRPVRDTMERMVLAAPIAGRIRRLHLTATLCRDLATMLGSGVELAEALRLSRDLSRSTRLGSALGDAYECLRQGRDFTAPLAASQTLQPLAIDMLRIGQETGDLARPCLQAADMLDAKLETAVQRLFRILEPAIVLVVSVVVGFIVMGILGAVVGVNDLLV